MSKLKYVGNQLRAVDRGWILCKLRSHGRNLEFYSKYYGKGLEDWRQIYNLIYLMKGSLTTIWRYNCREQQ